MKIAVSSYSFSKLYRDGTLNQLSSLAKAKELGFDAMEFFNITPHDGSSPEEYAGKLREEAKNQGLTLSNFTFGANFLEGDPGAEVERVKRLVDLAAVLGVSSIRHDASTGFPQREGRSRTFEDALPILADCCREITEYAQTLGIRTMVENHGFFCQDSTRVEKLVTAVGHDNFGLLVDIGNFQCADEDSVTAVGRVAPYAFYAHVKDFHIKSGKESAPGQGFFETRGGNFLRGAIVGHGNVPVLQCLRALKKAGYPGDLAIEFEGMEDPITGLSIGLANLRHYLALLG